MAFIPAKPDGGLSYLLLHRQITTPKNSFFKTTIILHWCKRFGFIQGVAIWEKDMVAVIKFSALATVTIFIQLQHSRLDKEVFR